MAKLRIDGSFVVRVIREDPRELISMLAVGGERVSFEAVIEKGRTVIKVDGRDDIEVIRHSLQPLLEVVKVVYPDKIVREE